MNPPSDWIKMSDRQPTEKDLPVEYYSQNNLFSDRRWIRFHSLRDWRTATHWRHHESVPLPPAEPTQHEKDVAAWNNLICSNSEYPYPRNAWHAALAYERAEVAALLEEPDFKAIRARCQKQA